MHTAGRWWWWVSKFGDSIAGPIIPPISICNCDINTAEQARSGDIRSFGMKGELGYGWARGTHVHRYTMEMREQGKQFDKAMQSP